MYIITSTYLSHPHDIRLTTRALVRGSSGMNFFDDAVTSTFCVKFATKSDAKIWLFDQYFQNGKIPKGFKIIKEKDFNAAICA
jgi:hypothetical protein